MSASLVGPVALTVVVVALSVSRPGGRRRGAPLPRLPAATGKSRVSCTELATAFRFPDTTVMSAAPVGSGVLTWAGRAIDAHCLVKGEMHRRTSPEDGKSYAIGFEMRLPTAWNGRFFYQANGGSDGSSIDGSRWVRRPAMPTLRRVAAGLCGHQLGRRPFGIPAI